MQSLRQYHTKKVVSEKFSSDDRDHDRSTYFSHLRSHLFCIWCAVYRNRYHKSGVMHNIKNNVQSCTHVQLFSLLPRGLTFYAIFFMLTICSCAFSIVFLTVAVSLVILSDLYSSLSSNSSTFTSHFFILLLVI